MDKSSSPLVRQLTRFASVGAMATIIHTVVALVAIRIFDFSSTAANVSAFLTATLFSYALNSTWSFETGLALRTLIRFFVVSIFNLGIIVVISQLVDQLAYPSELSVLVVIITMPLITFIFHRYWTFKG